MPLVTEILRNGKVTTPNGGWSDFALNAMFTAALLEGDPEMKFESGAKVNEIEPGLVMDFVWRNPIYLFPRGHMDLIDKGVQTLHDSHVFRSHSDPDHEYFQEVSFLPGDVLRAWRE